MMDKQELEQFKQVVESDLVTERLNEVGKENRREFIAALIHFLVLTKDYKNTECYIYDFLFYENSTLPVGYLTEEKGLTQKEAEAFMYDNFINDGYLYHVTKSDHLDSILEKGLVSLNKRFNEDLYDECIKVNTCFNNLLKRNNRIQTNLIKIPMHKDLYKTRFESIYLSANLDAILVLYGSSSELFYDFLDRWISRLSVKKESMDLPKEELRQQMIEGMQMYQYDDWELDTLLHFYDKHYEQIRTTDKLEEKAIIMVSNENIQDNAKHTLCNYNELIQNKEYFSSHFNSCYDIECPCDIKPENLIAITMDSVDKSKVKLKVHTTNT